ncbi:HD domain [Segatella buccae]|uniref:HD domain n=2 Tax=Segatella buccae TaxID=28126 RepID=A0AAQ1ZHQ7_9BACT|nr:HD domain [Segatella buccae]
MLLRRNSIGGFYIRFSQMNDSKIINDPVFGFIKIPKGILLDIVKHPLMQRLTRIKQNGLASVVYPGAQHTRFQHSIGAYHLMSEAVLSLQQKGHFIFDSEAEAVEAAILMHDIGHAPFSHVLEGTLIHDISHEEISLMMMEKINREMNGALNLALKIFKDEYPKRFLHQLISSQLDMDRLDYLRRDSFFTGVTEGNIGSARIIKMLDVVEDQLVVESKGIYSVENYLTSRRLMYWQVYLHKTAVGYEKILVNLLKRAKHLAAEGQEVFASPQLAYFLYNNVDATFFHEHDKSLDMYELLDDNDIWSSAKVWMHHEDRILALLASDFVNRQLFKMEVQETPFEAEHLDHIRQGLIDNLHVSEDEVEYLMSYNTIAKDMYEADEDRITIVYKDGSMKDIADASDLFNIAIPSKKIRKYYLCHQRF